MTHAVKAPLRAVLFDLDGTLLDTAPDFITCVNLLRAEERLPPLPDARIRADVSNGTRGLVRMAFGLAESDAAFEPLRQRLLVHYAANLHVRTTPFPGIAALLDTLARQGIRWGVVTNKPASLAEPLLARCGLQPPASVIVCPEHVRRTKPDPEPLLLACARLGIDAAEAVYVGDHRRDIDAGRGAGMPTIAASYGYLEPGEDLRDWSADHIADSAIAIEAILDTHFLRHQGTR